MVRNQGRDADKLFSGYGVNRQTNGDAVVFWVGRTTTRSTADAITIELPIELAGGGSASVAIALNPDNDTFTARCTIDPGADRPRGSAAVGVVHEKLTIWLAESGISWAEDGGEKDSTTSNPEAPQTPPPADTEQKAEAAELLAEAGYRVELDPIVDGDENPDYRIDGRLFHYYRADSDDIDDLVTGLAATVRGQRARRIVADLSGTVFTLADLAARLRQQPTIPGLDEVVAINYDGYAIPVFSGDAIVEIPPDVSGAIVVQATPRVLREIGDANRAMASGSDWTSRVVTAATVESRTTVGEAGKRGNTRALTLRAVGASGVSHHQIREALGLPDPPGIEIESNGLTVRCEIALYHSAEEGAIVYVTYGSPEVGNPEFDTVRRMIDAALLDHFPDEAIAVREAYDYEYFSDVRPYDHPRIIGPQPPSSANRTAVVEAAPSPRARCASRSGGRSWTDSVYRTRWLRPRLSARTRRRRCCRRSRC